MRFIDRGVPAALLMVALAAAAPAAGQSVTDGSESAVGAENAAAVFALIGKGMKDPASALYARLRRGRAGAFCGEVDATNRMGTHTGLRPFVVEPAGGFGGIVPDAPELRNPSSMAQYQAMQRTLDLYRANCAAQ